MDYSDGDASDHNPVGEVLYPDIDETNQYPWQGSQPSASAQPSIQSVIDPRLYKGLFASNASQAQDQSFINERELEQDDSAEDSSYELSSEEEPSTDEEASDQSVEGSDEDEEYSRRRRRRRTGPFSGRYGARGGKGIKRGPRKPLEPSPEFKILHSEATSAFIDGDYDRAIELVKRAIQINPEMFAAHSLLSEIFLAKGEKDKAVGALFSGAHTRPRDASVWAKVARMIMEQAGEDRQAALNDVIYCHSRVIEIDPKNYNARFQRAAIYRELGYNGRAATEYERILKELPHNARALRHLAETYIDQNEVQKAVDYWSESVQYYMTQDPEKNPEFTWSDANIYVELYTYLGQHFEGLKALKSVSRWLLGRRDDKMWKDFDEDDREWDADDSPRRIKAHGYVPKRWPRDSYGLGLPLELRIKMGLFRLKLGYEHQEEALHHFGWLNPEDTSEGARIFDYGDLFREVADALTQAGLLEEALRFYMPIQQTNEYADVSFFMAMGDCCRLLGRLEDAENCYLTVSEYDVRNIESRVQLAKLYESIGMTEQALKYVNDAVLLGRQETRSHRRRKDTRLDQLAKEFKTADATAETEDLEYPEGIAGGPTGALGTKFGEEGDSERTDNIQFLYSKLLQLQPKLQEGNPETTEDWLDIADALLREFRSNRVFYPLQRSVVFLGYSHELQKKGGQKSLMDEMQEMAGRLQESLGTITEEPLQAAIPTDYYGIKFDEWLDLFLQYALVVAGQNESGEAYDTLAAAADASVWYHSKNSTRLIHVCWFTCALRVQDEETLANEARWFIKEYQFVTDTYRLFSILSRLCGDPHRSLFHSSPNMKFMLRQIKAMDFTLPESIRGTRPNKPIRESIYKERAALSTKDDMGEAIPAEEMDVALLVLYGHILYSGNSFYPALNYFFRAYALDDQNPAVLLSIGLCYIHHSLKRQSENRHYQIMQGLSFMNEYRRVRERPGSLLIERQEMEFNFARIWQSLGLAHLAVEGYKRVLELGKQIQAQSRGSEAPGQKDGNDVVMADVDPAITGVVTTISTFVEDFSREAALALQGIYATNGDFQSAQAITAAWLVI
ncbi:RNA polymerase III transcription factor TFIIIC subunit (Tfc4) [Aspergillus rambellii]|uniref:RNA polymerase III transcription factor TFIIIC subunit (Tfc4) n=1 Tax=Aspergillus rambellii TaxID=308745 RepID=A0A0F8W202_9EURO|nr:RNA polymerase III transcription factor TFIIIC subunit (Tfc4) [Aspergillus rambellii]